MKQLFSLSSASLLIGVDAGIIRSAWAPGRIVLRHEEAVGIFGPVEEGFAIGWGYSLSHLVEGDGNLSADIICVSS